jgi:hypothetical protein
VSAEDGGGRVEQVAVSLLLIESADAAHHAARRKAERGSHLAGRSRATGANL